MLFHRSRVDTACIRLLLCWEQEMERVAQETMDKAMTYQTELENQKASGQKQVRPRQQSRK